MCIVSAYVGTWGEKILCLVFYYNILRDRYVAIQFDQYLSIPWDCVLGSIFLRRDNFLTANGDSVIPRLLKTEWLI